MPIHGIACLAPCFEVDFTLYRPVIIRADMPVSTNRLTFFYWAASSIRSLSEYVNFAQSIIRNPIKLPLAWLFVAPVNLLPHTMTRFPPIKDNWWRGLVVRIVSDSPCHILYGTPIILH
jgi:hypothetical protein